MVRNIVRDRFFLSLKSENAVKTDMPIAVDLLDTLRANSGRCIGMAANMIGFTKRIIIFDSDGIYVTMFNPQIISASGVYEAQEGCLSLDGIRKVRRYKKIKVQYADIEFKTEMKTFDGICAQIIQHEIDHCNGILI